MGFSSTSQNDWYDSDQISWNCGFSHIPRYNQHPVKVEKGLKDKSESEKVHQSQHSERTNNLEESVTSSTLDESMTSSILGENMNSSTFEENMNSSTLEDNIDSSILEESMKSSTFPDGILMDSTGVTDGTADSDEEFSVNRLELSGYANANRWHWKASCLFAD